MRPSLAPNADLPHTGAVRRGRPTPNRPEGLKPIAAAFAVFALLIQALLPSAAMAARAPDASMVICTLTGATTAQVAPAAPREPSKGFAGMPCQDCLAASVAALEPPVLAFEPVSVGYAAVEHHARPAVRLAFARAPPRPLGQGPPTA